MKQSQVLGIHKSVKARVQKEVTALYRTVQAPMLFAGLSRTYQPSDDEGETFPPEGNQVQHNVDECLTELRRLESELLDITATREWGNLKAGADLIVDDETLLTGVPVTYLLFLQKRLDDLLTFVRSLPTLDPSDTWTVGDDGLYRGTPVETVKSKKLPRTLLRAPATKEHPAQTEVYHEDVAVGTWTRINFSGAIKPVDRDIILRRLEKLRDAVISAREAANTIDVENKEVGDTLFGYIFGSTARL